MLRHALAIMLFLPFPGLARAADDRPAAPDSDENVKHRFGSFVLENDLFAGFDDDYTNGIQLSYLSDATVLPWWIRRAAARFPFYPSGPEDSEDSKLQVRGTVSLGQAMYTPADISLRDPPRDDRPYAGWLYGAVGLIAKTEQELHQLQLQVGVVGPLSFAEESQRFVHQVKGAPEPRGWSHQLKNEPGVVLTYQYSRHLDDEPTPIGNTGLMLDVTPHVGGAVGNVFTYLNAGITFRLGGNLPDDYGPPRIQPGLPGNGYFAANPDGRLGWYLFAGLDGRLVARNIFLDGNTFADSRDVKKHPLVGDIQAGAALTWDRFRLAYTHVFRTKEWGDEGGEDAFGALSLTVRF